LVAALFVGLLFFWNWRAKRWLEENGRDGEPETELDRWMREEKQRERATSLRYSRVPMFFLRAFLDSRLRPRKCFDVVQMLYRIEPQIIVAITGVRAPLEDWVGDTVGGKRGGVQTV
jgi:hypothetical protein